MSEEQKVAEEKSCCGQSRCCGKAAAALVLLLVGGIVGFFVGSHCGRGMCPVASMSTPAQSEKR